ncbi:MAG: exo-alpha-sialidase [Clostridia bacterium]|nr:exo-alpha-sialidase [Clostridia bacterium]
MIVERSAGEYTDFRIPGIVATDGGSLLRYCECRRSGSDWADIDIKISRSEDFGNTWETVLLIKSGGCTLNNPVMLICGHKLIFLYCKNYKEIWKCVSTDDGKSFGDAIRVDFEDHVDFFFNAVAVGPGHGIVHGQRLLIPIWFACNQQDAKAHRPSFISTLYSDDGGESWKLGERIFENELRNPSECALAITNEGEVLISIRHEGEIRTRALAKSADGISLWHDLRFEENLPDPICMGSMTDRNGVIYHSNCDSVSERRNLTVKVSNDLFKSCRSILVSELGGYSDIALLGDKLCVLYEKTVVSHQDGKAVWCPFELFFEVFEIDRIYSTPLPQK